MNDLNGSLTKSYLLLKSLKDAYARENDATSEDIEEVIDVLCELSHKVDSLNKKVVELEKRLESVNWAFGGGVT